MFIWFIVVYCFVFMLVTSGGILYHRLSRRMRGVCEGYSRGLRVSCRVFAGILRKTHLHLPSRGGSCILHGICRHPAEDPSASARISRDAAGRPPRLNRAMVLVMTLSPAPTSVRGENTPLVEVRYSTFTFPRLEKHGAIETETRRC